MSTQLDVLNMQRLHLQHTIEKANEELQRVEDDIQKEEIRSRVVRGNTFMYPSKMQGNKVTEVRFMVPAYTKQTKEAQLVLARVRAMPGVVSVRGKDGDTMMPTIHYDFMGGLIAMRIKVRDLLYHLFPAFASVDDAQFAIKAIGELELRRAARIMAFDFDDTLPKPAVKEAKNLPKAVGIDPGQETLPCTLQGIDLDRKGWQDNKM